MPFDAEPLAFDDIVLVPFPYTDQSAAKRRPAVIVSNAGYQTRHPDVIVMPVTSQLRGDARPDDVPVESWLQAGLLKPSAIKPVIATLEAGMILRRLGALLDDDRRALRAMLAMLIG